MFVSWREGNGRLKYIYSWERAGKLERSRKSKRSLTSLEFVKKIP